MVHFTYLIIALPLTVTTYHVRAAALAEFNSTNLESYESTCVELFNPKVIMYGCCKMMELVAEDMRVCKKWDTPWTCDDSICMLELYELMDGEQVHELKVRDLILETERRLGSPATGFARRATNLCLSGRHDDYAPFVRVDCSPLKYQICVFVNAVVYETTWRKNLQCVHIHRLARKCKAVLDMIYRDFEQRQDLYDELF